MKNSKTPHYRNKGFTKIDGLLYKTAETYHLRRVFYKFQLSKHWETVLLDFLQEGRGQTKILDFKDGVLVVACLSKTLAHEIRFLAARISYNLNKLLGGMIVKTIRVES